MIHLKIYIAIHWRIPPIESAPNLLLGKLFDEIYMKMKETRPRGRGYLEWNSRTDSKKYIVTSTALQKSFSSFHIITPLHIKKIDVVNVVHMLARDVDVAKRRC